MEKELRKIVAERIVFLRKKKGFSQTEFALRAGVHRTHLIDIEKCDIDFGIDTLEKIIWGFNLKPSEFFHDN